MVDYVDTHTPIYIKCDKGHIFRQKPCDHLHGHACPICNESRGEKDIEDYLKDRGVQFIREYKVKPEPRLFGRKYFRADFFLPDQNIMIEYHGEQHFKTVGLWNFDERRLQEQQDRDMRLREYCNVNGIKLIEIPYTKRKSIKRILCQIIR